jgi:flagellar protein FlaG
MDIELRSAVNGLTTTAPVSKAPETQERQRLEPLSKPAAEKFFNDMSRISSDRGDNSSAVKFLEKTIKRANERLVGIPSHMELSVHEGTREIMIKIVNTEKNEIIKEIPPERTLDAIAKMWELVGLFVDEAR